MTFMDRNEVAHADDDESRSALDALTESERHWPRGAHAARDGYSDGDYDFYEPQDPVR